MPTDRSTTVTRPGADDVAVAAEVVVEAAERGTPIVAASVARRGPIAGSALSALALAFALLPIVVAAVRAIRGDWVPLGDTAVVALRSGDVFGGGELPLLGTWSAKSWALGFHTHHPGPLFFDVMAVPGSLLPGPTGQIVGAALVNGLSVIGVFVLARRRGGQPAALAALVVVSGLCWSMGPAVLAEPWNVSALLLPYFCFCLLAWSLACRDGACLPWAVFLGSFLIQANLAFLPLVGGLVVTAAVLAFLDGRRESAAATGDREGTGARHHRLRRLARNRHDDGTDRTRLAGPSPSPTRWRRVVVAAGVGLVCWIQPLVEQFTADDYGNMSRLARSATEHTPTVGMTNGIRMVARVVALPPWWGRPSYADAFGFTAFGNVLPSLWVSAFALVLLVGGLLGAGRLARRRGDHTLSALLVLAVVLVGMALATAQVTPRNGAFGTTSYQLRWLWPIAAFVTLALLTTVVRAVAGTESDAHGGPGGAPPTRHGRRSGADVAGSVSVGLAALTGLFAVLNLPSTRYGTTAPAEVLPVAHELVAEVAAANLEGPLLVQCDEGLFDPYCEAVMVELQDQGVDFMMDNVIDLQQVGFGRRYDGQNAVARLVVTTGDMTADPRPRARVVAAYEGLDDDEVLERFYLEEHFKHLAQDDQLVLNARGRAVAARGDLPSVDLSGPTPRIDPAAVVGLRSTLFGEHRRDLVAMIHEDLVDLDPQTAALAERYVQLQTLWDGHTVAVFVEPLPAPPG